MTRRIRLVLLLLLMPVCLFIGIPTINKYFAEKHNELPALYHYLQPRDAASPDQKDGSIFNLDTIVETKQNRTLPQSIIDHIKTFVLFLGYPHSGHSIVGSLMDGHPHMVIAHELGVFTKLSRGLLSPTKEDIFNAIWKRTVLTIISGQRAEHAKGYDLLVDGLYQGNYVDHVDVIGDKSGGTSADLLLTQPREWLGSYHVLQSLNITLKVIQVFRNPYDIIASSVLLKKHSKVAFANFKQSNTNKKYSSDGVDLEIKKFFLHHHAIVNAKKTYNLDIIEVHGKDLIADPRGTLLKLCNHVGVNCSSGYLTACSSKVFKSESKTRRLIKWTKKQLKMIQTNIDKYSDLRGYSLDSL